MTTKLLIHTVPLTAATLVAAQIGDIYEAMRAARSGHDFIPNQFGGLYGQRELIRDKMAATFTKIRPTQGD